MLFCPSFINPKSLLCTSSQNLFFPLHLLSPSLSSFPFPAFLHESSSGPHFSALHDCSLSHIPHLPTHLLTFFLYFTQSGFSLFFQPFLCHPCRHFSFFPSSFPVHLFLCDIYNGKHSRRELTHTWPSSVSPAVTDNLSSAERRGHFSPFFFCPFLVVFQSVFNLFLCSVFNRDTDSCQETSGEATTTSVKRDRLSPRTKHPKISCNPC